MPRSPRKPRVRHPRGPYESSEKTLRFKSKEDYRKWNAARNMHYKKRTHPKGYYKVEIAGKPHKVKHQR